MKKYLLPAALAVLLTACSGDENASDGGEMDPKIEMEIQKSDSLSQELDKVGAELKSETESTKEEVESLLEGI